MFNKFTDELLIVAESVTDFCKESELDSLSLSLDYSTEGRRGLIRMLIGFDYLSKVPYFFLFLRNR